MPLVPILLDGVIKGAEGESPIKLLSPVASSARAIRSARYFFDAGRNPDIARQSAPAADASESADLAVEFLSRPAGICVAD